MNNNEDPEKVEDSRGQETHTLRTMPPNEKEEAGASDSQSSKQSSEAVPHGEEAEEAARPQPSRSITSSISPSPVKIRRSARRGLFGRFTLLAEVEEPKLYDRRTKWFITFLIAMAAMAAPLGSAIFFRMSLSVGFTE